MTVYVDDLWPWPGPVAPAARRHAQSKWCHLMVGTDDRLGELHEFAEGIGLKREWFQNRRGYPHYDLVASMRKRAVSAGAVELSCMELIRTCKRDPLLQ